MAGPAEKRGSVVAQLPPLDRAYQIDFRLLSVRLAEIPDDVNGILKLFDGRRTLAQVLEEAGDHGGVAVARILARLWAEEIIRPAPPGAAPRAPGAEPRPGPATGSPARAVPPSAVPPSEPAEWFSGPADLDPAPDAPAAASWSAPGDSDRPREAAPRIVRFPARRRDPSELASREVTTARLLAAAATLEARLRTTPKQAPARRQVAATRMSRRSVAVLVLAGCLLAGVGIWRFMGIGSASTATPTQAPSSK